MIRWVLCVWGYIFFYRVKEIISPNEATSLFLVGVEIINSFI